MPLNYLSATPLPISAPSLVLAKSNGYTTKREVPPAKPPEIILYKANFPALVFLSVFGNNVL
jgi:hypothetical protein